MDDVRPSFEFDSSPLLLRDQRYKQQFGARDVCRASQRESGKFKNIWSNCFSMFRKENWNEHDIFGLQIIKDCKYKRSYKRTCLKFALTKAQSIRYPTSAAPRARLRDWALVRAIQNQMCYNFACFSLSDDAATLVRIELSGLQSWWERIAVQAFD